MDEGGLGYRSPVIRLRPADIPITRSPHEAPARRAGAPVEADRAERILPCCMVIPVIPRCPSSTHARRRCRGVELADERRINHGILMSLCGTFTSIHWCHRISFLLCNDSGKLLPSSDHRFPIRRPYRYASLHYLLRCAGISGVR